jgi:hypothetical protein
MLSLALHGPWNYWRHPLAFKAAHLKWLPWTLKVTLSAGAQNPGWLGVGVPFPWFYQWLMGAVVERMNVWPPCLKYSYLWDSFVLQRDQAADIPLGSCLKTHPCFPSSPWPSVSPCLISSFVLSSWKHFFNKSLAPQSLAQNVLLRNLSQDNGGLVVASYWSLLRETIYRCSYHSGKGKRHQSIGEGTYDSIGSANDGANKRAHLGTWKSSATWKTQHGMSKARELKAPIAAFGHQGQTSMEENEDVCAWLFHISTQVWHHLEALLFLMMSRKHWSCENTSGTCRWCEDLRKRKSNWGDYEMWQR